MDGRRLPAVTFRGTLDEAYIYAHGNARSHAGCPDKSTCLAGSSAKAICSEHSLKVTTEAADVLGLRAVRRQQPSLSGSSGQRGVHVPSELIRRARHRDVELLRLRKEVDGRAGGTDHARPQGSEVPRGGHRGAFEKHAQRATPRRRERRRPLGEPAGVGGQQVGVLPVVLLEAALDAVGLRLPAEQAEGELRRLEEGEVGAAQDGVHAVADGGEVLAAAAHEEVARHAQRRLALHAVRELELPLREGEDPHEGGGVAESLGELAAEFSRPPRVEAGEKREGAPDVFGEVSLRREEIEERRGQGQRHRDRVARRVAQQPAKRPRLGLRLVGGRTGEREQRGAALLRREQAGGWRGGGGEEAAEELRRRPFLARGVDEEEGVLQLELRGNA
mmetsp:Transcript_32558/g.68266  ORF Transcript_32558/g.68266 Transcript_32558/m.68266 type:complete len:390 (-) Transcript_32558:22-1191(-)